MTKAELIARLISLMPTMDPRKVEASFLTLMDHISESLVAGNRIELRNFGIFGLKEHSAHEGRNPRTGERVQVTKKKVPYFKAGKKLKEAVNQLHKVD